MPLAPPNLAHGHLPAPSWIRVDRIVTLNASLVVKPIGRVSAVTVDAAVERLCARIGHMLGKG